LADNLLSSRPACQSSVVVLIAVKRYSHLCRKMSRRDRRETSPEAVAYLIYHLVLPPELPQSDDPDRRFENVLLETTIDALKEFQGHMDNEVHRQQVGSVVFMVVNLLNSRDAYQAVSESQLASILAGLINGTMERSVAIEIKAQNAGLLLSKYQGSIVVESFELSPTNADVMATNGRLVRSFPASASKIKTELFRGTDLRATLAKTIARLASQTAPGFQPQARKAGQEHDEMRDTTHPGMVTDFFMSVISALGEPTEISTISKHMRDEVLWSDSLQPWRRSSLWLLLRVSMQLQFSRDATRANSKRSLYKPFMAFLLARVLNLARVSNGIGVDFLHAACVKLSRRIKKLKIPSEDAHCSSSWMEAVSNILFSTHDLVKMKWQGILDGPGLQMEPKKIEELRPENDLDVSLPELDIFIRDMATRKTNTEATNVHLTGEYHELFAHDFPIGRTHYGDQYFQLASIESWVENHLSQWLDDHIGEENTTLKLRQLIEEYYGMAQSVYGVPYEELPRGISIMYLTIMELWVACDKSACHIYPLVSEYDPEIPMELLQSVLLPFQYQMRRLSIVESYIQSRRDIGRSHHGYRPSIFREFGRPTSFAVRFFDSSEAHQALLLQIEREATNDRNAKCDELENKKRQYRACMEQSDQINACSTRFVVTNEEYGTGHDEHSPSCQKCYLKSVANSIGIRIYEWPLSSDRHVAKSTVFELQVPPVFQNWRDVTVFLLSDVLGSEYECTDRPRARYILRDDIGLRSSFSQPNCGPTRISILSGVKPNARTHRKEKGKGGGIVRLTDTDVCLNNGLQYRYFDNDRDTFTCTLETTNTVLRRCMVSFPDRSSQLQKYIFRSPSQPDGISPNEVIAGQSDCPAHMSLNEYKSFCTLPLGHRIQYMNILTQLSMPALDFSKAETQLLILQTVLQAGPQSPTGINERATHEILAEEHFGKVMIDQLELALQRTSENWESWRALASFVQLAIRLLSLAASSEIQNKCLLYLVKARKVCSKWLTLVRSRARAAADDGQRAELYSRSVEIALLSISTFDVDQHYVTKILQDPSAASFLLQCSIVVQENKKSVSSDHKSLYQGMLQSWRSLAYRILQTLRYEIIQHGNNCLDDAIASSWSGFCSGASWESVGSPYGHWLVMKPVPTINAAHRLSHTV
jgi:hypothetical protein